MCYLNSRKGPSLPANVNNELEEIAYQQRPQAEKAPPEGVMHVCAEARSP